MSFRKTNLDSLPLLISFFFKVCHQSQRYALRKSMPGCKLCKICNLQTFLLHFVTQGDALILCSLHICAASSAICCKVANLHSFDKVEISTQPFSLLSNLCSTRDHAKAACCTASLLAAIPVRNLGMESRVGLVCSFGSPSQTFPQNGPTKRRGGLFLPDLGTA